MIEHNLPEPDDAPWLNLFVAGEGYHKQHHLNQKKIKLHKWDTAGWIADKLFPKYKKA